MASKKDSVIFYQSQINICKKHLTTEQFGRLMYALFEVDEGNDPEVDDDIAMAFDFMSLQKKLDKEKYEEKCRKNRENGKKGGRPPKPKKANGLFQNPNDNENDNENDNDNENEEIQHSVYSGLWGNVDLTGEEYAALQNQYESTKPLIDKVSIWLRDAEHDVPDHYALCVKFAINSKWPKRKPYVPPEIPKVDDPISEDEQKQLMAEMHKKLDSALLPG